METDSICSATWIPGDCCLPSEPVWPVWAARCSSSVRTRKSKATSAVATRRTCIWWKLQALPGQNVKRMCRHSVPSSGSSTRLRTLCKCNLQAWYSGWLVMGLPYNVSHSKLPGVAAHSTSCHLARRFLCRSRLLMLNILWKASWVRNVYRVWDHRYLIKLQYVSREIRKMRIDHRCSNASKHDMILTISCHIYTVWYNYYLLFVCPFPFPDSSAKVQVLATQRDLTQKTTNWLSEADESLGGCEWLGS